MFGSGLVALIIAFGLLPFVIDDGSDSVSPEDDTPDDRDPGSRPDPEDDPNVTGQGGAGDDLILAQDDVGVYDGFGGNDSLAGSAEFGVRLNGGTGDDVIAVLDNDHGFGGDGNDLILGEQVGNAGPAQVMRGGAGNDTLVTSGGSVMVGGNGEDVFVVSPGGTDENGNMQSLFGDPLDPPLIRDFDPEEDRLVIDLARSFQGQFDDIVRTEFGAPDGARDPIDFDGPVNLTAERSDDGSAVVILANGVAMAHLDGFTDMDPEDVLGLVDVTVLGGSDGDTGPVPGLLFKDLGNGNVQLSLTDDFAGGGSYGGGEEFSRLNLSQVTTDLRVTVEEDGVITVQPIDESWPAVTFEEIDQVFVGSGNNVFDGSAGPAWVSVTAGEGADTILGSDRTDVGDRVNGFGFVQFVDGAATWVGTGATTVLGGAGNDGLSAGLGDSLTGGAGADTYAIHGYGADGAAPAIVTDFDPSEDVLDYVWVNPEGDTTPHDIALQDSADGLVILDDGQVVALLPGVTLADNPIINTGEGVNIPI